MRERQRTYHERDNCGMDTSFSSTGREFIYFECSLKKEIISKFPDMEEIQIVWEITLWIGKEKSSANNTSPRTETSIAVLLYL